MRFYGYGVVRFYGYGVIRLWGYTVVRLYGCGVQMFGYKVIKFTMLHGLEILREPVCINVFPHNHKTVKPHNRITS